MSAVIGPAVALLTPTGKRLHKGTALVEQGIVLGYETGCGRTLNADTVSLVGVWDARPIDGIVCRWCDR